MYAQTPGRQGNLTKVLVCRSLVTVLLCAAGLTLLSSLAQYFLVALFMPRHGLGCKTTYSVGYNVMTMHVSAAGLPLLCPPTQPCWEALCTHRHPDTAST